MSITNVKSMTRCPKCLNHGVVQRKEKELVAMECPEQDCKQKWKTYSQTCPHCLKPNGYAVKGPCMACYSLRYKSS